MPEQTDCAGVEAAGEDAETGDDVDAAGRSQQQRPGCIGTLKRNRAVGEIELRGTGVKADQYSIGTKGERVLKQIAPAGKVKHGLLINCFLDGERVIGMAVAFDAEDMNVDPGGRIRQRADRRRCRGWENG